MVQESMKISTLIAVVKAMIEKNIFDDALSSLWHVVVIRDVYKFKRSRRKFDHFLIVHVLYNRIIISLSIYLSSRRHGHI